MRFLFANGVVGIFSLNNGVGDEAGGKVIKKRFSLRCLFNKGSEGKN